MEEEEDVDSTGGSGPYFTPPEFLNKGLVRAELTKPHTTNPKPCNSTLMFLQSTKP